MSSMTTGPPQCRLPSAELKTSPSPSIKDISVSAEMPWPQAPRTGVKTRELTGEGISQSALQELKQSGEAIKTKPHWSRFHWVPWCISQRNLMSVHLTQVGAVQGLISTASKHEDQSQGTREWKGRYHSNRQLAVGRHAILPPFLLLHPLPPLPPPSSSLRILHHLRVRYVQTHNRWTQTPPLVWLWKEIHFMHGIRITSEVRRCKYLLLDHTAQKHSSALPQVIPIPKLLPTNVYLIMGRWLPTHQSHGKDSQPFIQNSLWVTEVKTGQNQAM